MSSISNNGRAKATDSRTYSRVTAPLMLQMAPRKLQTTSYTAKTEAQTTTSSTSSKASSTVTYSTRNETHNAFGYPVSKKTNTDPLLKTCPKPDGEINVKESLNRRPGRWTIQGQINHNRKLAVAKVASEKAVAELRRKESREETFKGLSRACEQLSAACRKQNARHEVGEFV